MCWRNNQANFCCEHNISVIDYDNIAVIEHLCSTKNLSPFAMCNTAVFFCWLASKTDMILCSIWFCHMQVVLRRWKVSLRSNVRVKPAEVTESYEDFLYDYKGQSMYVCYKSEDLLVLYTTCIVFWISWYIMHIIGDGFSWNWYVNSVDILSTVLIYS